MLAVKSGARKAVFRSFVLAAGVIVSAATLWGCSSNSGSAGSMTVRVNPASQTASVGKDDVKVTVELTGFGGESPAAYEFHLNFDPAILELQDSDYGAFITSAGRKQMCVPPRIDNTKGLAHIVCPSTGDQKSKPNAPLATFTFRTLSAGNSPLSLTKVILTDSLGEVLTADQEDGEIAVE